MHTYPSGHFYIHSKDEQTVVTNLEKHPCSSFVGEDYRDYLKEPFDYQEVFHYVIRMLKADKGTLADGIDLDAYDCPDTREAFNRSPLWADLGFIISPNFAIQYIVKEFTLTYASTHGQKATTLLLFESEEVHQLVDTEVWNRLDELIFDWKEMFDADGEYHSGSDIIERFVNCFREWEGDDMETAVREVAATIYFERGEDTFVINPDSRLKEADIQAILNILKTAEDNME